MPLLDPDSGLLVLAGTVSEKLKPPPVSAPWGWCLHWPGLRLTFVLNSLLGEGNAGCYLLSGGARIVLPRLHHCQAEWPPPPPGAPHVGPSASSSLSISFLRTG